MYLRLIKRKKKVQGKGCSIRGTEKFTEVKMEYEQNKSDIHFGTVVSLQIHIQVSKLYDITECQIVFIGREEWTHRRPPLSSFD